MLLYAEIFIAQAHLPIEKAIILYSDNNKLCDQGAGRTERSSVL